VKEFGRISGNVKRLTSK